MKQELSSMKEQVASPNTTMVSDEDITGPAVIQNLCT